MHPPPRKQNESGPSRERRDVEREGADQDDDPPPVPPKSGISKKAPVPTVSRGDESESTSTSPFQSLPLTDYAGRPVTLVPGHAIVTPKHKPDWKNTTSSAVKLLIRTAERASDALPPLKSAVGGLCAILESCEVLSLRLRSPSPQCLLFSQQTVVNKRTIESLGYRVDALADSICVPPSKGDTKEEMRREELQR